MADTSGTVVSPSPCCRSCVPSCSWVNGNNWQENVDPNKATVYKQVRGSNPIRQPVDRVVDGVTASPLFITSGFYALSQADRPLLLERHRGGQVSPTRIPRNSMRPMRVLTPPHRMHTGSSPRGIGTTASSISSEEVRPTSPTSSSPACCPRPSSNHLRGVWCGSRGAMHERATDMTGIA